MGDAAAAGRAMALQSANWKGLPKFSHASTISFIIAAGEHNPQLVRL
jgi:hypothetical protein